jgi:hypothetical protein
MIAVLLDGSTNISTASPDAATCGPPELPGFGRWDDSVGQFCERSVPMFPGSCVVSLAFGPTYVLERIIIIVAEPPAFGVTLN